MKVCSHYFLVRLLCAQNPSLDNVSMKSWAIKLSSLCSCVRYIYVRACKIYIYVRHLTYKHFTYMIMKTIMLPQFAVIYVMNDSRLYLDKLYLSHFSYKYVWPFSPRESQLQIWRLKFTVVLQTTQQVSGKLHNVCFGFIEKLKKVESYLFPNHTLTFIGHYIKCIYHISYNTLHLKKHN